MEHNQVCEMSLLTAATFDTDSSRRELSQKSLLLPKKLIPMWCKKEFPNDLILKLSTCFYTCICKCTEFLKGFVVRKGEWRGQHICMEVDFTFYFCTG